MSKYGNIKTTTSDGITHDSIKEANRWCELKLLEREGKIYDLQRQVKFTLIPAQYEYKYNDRKKQWLKGKCIERECSYIADFVYEDYESGDTVVEDVKGKRTKEYIIKRKLMLSVHKIQITEI